MELLKQAIVYMNEHRWGKVLDSGWFRWDIAVYCGAGLILNLVTAQEEHGSGRRLMRVRFRLTPSGLHKLAALTILTAAASAAFTHPWLGLALALAAAAGFAFAWSLGLRAASRVVRLFDGVALRLSMIPCPAVARPGSAIASEGEPASLSPRRSSSEGSRHVMSASEGIGP
jgi:hypothetical protein